VLCFEGWISIRNGSHLQRGGWRNILELLAD
jgi:hypothetical protein